MSNRRIKLGAPVSGPTPATIAAAHATAEVKEKNTIIHPLNDPLVEQERRQGWTIIRKIDGIERDVQAKPAQDEPRIRPSVMLAAFGAGLLALLTLFSGSTDTIKGIRAAIPDLMQEYGGYLDAQKHSLPTAEIERRKKMAEQHLLAAAAAEEIQDRQQMKRSLGDLMMLDNDTTSPLHRHGLAALRSILEESK
jgi:hypothetical protein